MKIIILLITVMLLSAIGCSKEKANNASGDTTAVQHQERTTASPKKPEMTFQVLATVTAVNQDKGKITIDHEKMEGFMEAMEMPFTVTNQDVFTQVQVGTKGHFTIEVTDGIGVVTAVHVLSK